MLTGHLTRCAPHCAASRSPGSCALLLAAGSPRAGRSVPTRIVGHEWPWGPHLAQWAHHTPGLRLAHGLTTRPRRGIRGRFRPHITSRTLPLALNLSHSLTRSLAHSLALCLAQTHQAGTRARTHAHTHTHQPLSLSLTQTHTHTQGKGGVAVSREPEGGTGGRRGRAAGRRGRAA